ncbi:MAG TPA: S41 family peptidase [Sphingomonadaceae bacterium]
MKFAPFFRSAALVTAVALLPAATAGFAEVEGNVSPEFQKLFLIYDQIKKNYVDPVDDKTLIKGAIDGMLASLDPHSAYLDGESLQRMQTLIDGNYEGLGISVTMDEGAVKVISPMKGSPAEKAGIKAGDYITHLDGKLIYGLPLDDAVAQMRGSAGTPLKLTIYRPGRPDNFDVTVVRGVIDMDPVTSELHDGGLGVISVNEFSKDTGKDVLKAYTDLRTKAGGKLNGLVLDLRSNPGGSLGEAVILSDLFLDHGTIVSQRGRQKSDNVTFNAETVYPGDMAKGVPMIVLIDAGTASASEIVAGALQDDQRALIMGERSFGKGSVQTFMPLTQDSALKLTTARYYTPSGRSVQEGGIEPDIAVPQLSDPDAAKRAKYAVRESDLRKHLINDIDLSEKQLEQDDVADPRFSETPEELEKKGIKDFQLEYALQTLRHTSGPALARK